MFNKIFALGLLGVGATLCTVGIYLVFVPAAFLFAGAAFIAVGVLGVDVDKGKE